MKLTKFVPPKPPIFSSQSTLRPGSSKPSKKSDEVIQVFMPNRPMSTSVQNNNNNNNSEVDNLSKIENVLRHMLNDVREARMRKQILITPNPNPYKFLALNPHRPITTQSFMLINQPIPPIDPKRDSDSNHQDNELVQSLLKHSAELAHLFLNVLKEQVKENFKQHPLRTAILFAVGTFVGLYYFAPNFLINQFAHEVFAWLGITPQIGAAIASVLTGAATALLPNTLELLGGMLEKMQHALSTLLGIEKTDNLQTQPTVKDGFAQIHEVLETTLAPHLEIWLGTQAVQQAELILDNNYIQT